MKARLACLMGTMAVAVGLVGLVVLAMLSSANAAPLASPTTTWTDNFDGPPLDSRWSWMNEDPAYWSLTAHPGFLCITTTEQNNNYLVQNAPPGNYEIQTRVLITPSENFQQAGLGIYLDDNNQLSLIRAYCGFPGCVGNGIYYDVVEGGVFHNYMITTTVQGEAYLRIVRQGNVYTGSVSENGIDWTVVGTPTVAFAPTKIGLRVGNNFQAAASEIPADFDYFVLVDHSHRVLLPLVLRNY